MSRLFVEGLFSHYELRTINYELTSFMRRINVFTSTMLFFMAVLLSGLAYVQIGRHERYRVMSEENRLKVVPLMAPRGSIFDSAGNALVKDELCFKVSVMYNRIRDLDSAIDVLSSILEEPKQEVASSIKNSHARPWSPVPIATDIGIEKAIQLEEIETDYPGLLLETFAKRGYLRGRTASNVLGHLGLINRSKFEKLKHYGYRIDDLVGKDGIEKYYDEYLMGRQGGKQVEVDHRGREVRTLGFREPTPGRDVYLTIDLDLQEFCDSLLEDKKGAIIVMDPATGAILAMASAPAYDPAVFIDRSRRNERGDVLKDKDCSLLNRAIAGCYPPGSVFKAVVAMAGLETGIASPGTMFECQGDLTLGRATFRCWKKKGHGGQVLKEALKNSCNVYFFNLGLLLGPDRISEFAGKFGFGALTGVDLPGENPGILPTRLWKNKRYNNKWYKGDTVNYSIGQGYLLSSPLQIVRMISVFANGGYLVKPYLVSEVGGVPVNDSEKVDLDISLASLETVREGLKKVVNDRTGTGMKARLDNMVVAGKTGTAQTAKGRSHGWFAGFAPFEDARLAVVVFDEYGGKGGYYAAQTAGKVFRKAGELGMYSL